MPSFAKAASTVVEQKRAGWRDPRPANQWMASLRRYAFPRIGEMAVSDVTSADVLEILTPIWHVKPALARNLCWRIRAALEWAVAMEYRADNPCDRLGPVLGPQYAVTQHLQALPHREAAGGDRDGAGVGGGARRRAGVRVHGPDGGEVRLGHVGSR